MPAYNDARRRPANDRPVNTSGDYVLYWCQSVRRLRANHALDRALAWGRQLGKPVVVYEGLRLDYPWANPRHHTFLLEGMRDNARAARALGLAYWPFVATPDEPGRGLLRKLAADACVVVTDDYPAFIVPAQSRALAAAVDVAVEMVEGNGLVPLALLGAAVSAAAHIRPRIHTQFAEAWRNRADGAPDVPRAGRPQPAPPFTPWDATCDIPTFVAGLGLDADVAPVPGVAGGADAGRRAVADFVAGRLGAYAEGRNQPDAPTRNSASRLSAYLRSGHVGIQEVAEAVLGDWGPAEINPRARGKREDFFARDPNVNSFLDEAVTWRDVGYHWNWRRNLALGAAGGRVSRSAEGAPAFNFETYDFSPCEKETLDVVLPEWAKATLRKHTRDRRSHLYDLAEFEAAATHDRLWNAAQRELVVTGRIHNYLRMLWAKKVLEWSESPGAAYRVLEHLNNKYALDGRDPNTYTGVLWCFGLFDRPWPPERDVFGSVRYMSCENTAKKYKLAGYYDYVDGLRARG